MLKIIKSMSELNTEQLMTVYKDTNQQIGQESNPYASAYQQLLHGEEKMLSYLRQDFFHQNGAFCAVWLCEGDYTSALRMERYLDGYLLTSLETAPQARRRGYANSLMMAVLEYLRASGCKVVYAHIEKRNTPSLCLHEKCGFERIAETASYIDGTVTLKSCTVCCRL